MKHTTEYLFDKPRSTYEPALTILAKMKIADGKKLLKKLAKRRAEGVLEPDDVVRYTNVEASVNWWKEMLDET